MVGRYVKVGQKCAFHNYQCLHSNSTMGKDAGLVRYPTALAPLTSSVTVTTQCADNAHGVSSSLMSCAPQVVAGLEQLLSVSVTLCIG